MPLTHIELTSSGSCGIRGKQVWSTIEWFGDQAERFLITSGVKSKSLEIKDGSISKHIPLIDRLISESLHVTSTKDGKLLIGVKKSGDIFAWSISSNRVYSIAGLKDFSQKGQTIDVHASGLLDKLLLVKNCSTFYLWLRLRRPTKARAPPKTTDIKGRWYTLDVSPQIPLPLDIADARLDAVSLEQSTLSSVTFVNSEGVLCLSTLSVTTEPSLYAQRTKPHAEWFFQPLAGSSTLPIVSSPDLLLIRYAPTLPICAVAINQLSVRDKCLIFVSPQHRYQVAANLKCLRESPASGRRPLWIADMKWTHNSLLLILLTQCGCLAILSRLGNPVYVGTREMTAAGAFDHLVSLLPRNINIPRKGNKLSRSLSLSSSSQQAVVSLSSHPFAMKFLISDGHQVLIFQIPEDITTRSLAMALLSDARMPSPSRNSHTTDIRGTNTETAIGIEEPVDQLVTQNSLKVLMQVWSLLTSAYEWSKELKDVSNQVVIATAEVVCSMILPSDIEGSAARLVQAAVQIATMIAIDTDKQHMLPGTIKLMSNMVEALLAYRESEKEAEIRVAEVAYVLTRVCEAVLIRTYSLLPSLDSQVMAGDHVGKSTYEVVGNTYSAMEAVIPTNQETDASTGEVSGTSNNELTTLNVNSVSSITVCLAPLYKKLQAHLGSLCKADLGGVADPSRLYRLLEVVQGVLRQRFPQLIPDFNTVWLHSDILCLEGFQTAAISEWMEKTYVSGDVHRVTNALHSILYNKLSNGKVSDALQFVENLILKNLSQQVPTQEKEYLNIRCLSANSPVKKLVQSLARFMGRYFTDSSLFVFPSHNPAVLPVLYSPPSDGVPVIGVDRRGICEAVKKLPSEEMWSVSATVRYFLISGLLAELVWFCKAVGDLKSALCVSLIVSDHSTSLKHIRRQQVNSFLPEDLKPEFIHEQMFGPLLRGDQAMPDEVHNSTYNMVLPTALFGFPSLVNQLQPLWKRIKQTASQLLAFVPNDLYLPFPAIYCPQPSSESECDLSEELKAELALRGSLSADIQSVLSLLTATYTDLPCCGWLVRGLIDAWKVKNKKKHKLKLAKALEVYLPYHILEKDKDNRLTLAIFRNICAILWMVHIRDQLSLMLRKSTKLLQDWVTISSQDNNEDSVQARHMHLEETLTWCMRYLPFAQYLHSANAICEVIISICEELPATAKLARKLAQGITDIDALAPEIKDRMEHLLQTWQTIELDPHESRSLNMYYFECCNRHDDRTRKDEIEKHIFSSTLGHKNIGSRGYEYDTEFMAFMELFFEVAFRSSLPDGGTAKPPALVPTNKKALEQISFHKRNLSFDFKCNDLEKTLDRLSLGVEDTSELEMAPARSVSPSKSGMFTKKRHSLSEEKTVHQLKRMGVPMDQIQRKVAKGSEPARLPAASTELLTQRVELSERYQRLGVKFQWLLTWSDTQLGNLSSEKPCTKVRIDLQWMLLALIMVEKSRQMHTRSLQPPANRAIPPVASEQATAILSPVVSEEAPALSKIGGKQTRSEDLNTSALANAISLHASTDGEQGVTDEEIQDREELLEEMRKHSRLATATQPINQAYPKRTGAEMVETSREEETDVQRSGDSFLLEDSATTVWSSASLPNMSGSSQVTAAPAETLDTMEPLSSGKTQKSVSTIGSRKSKSRRRTPERFSLPLAESTQVAGGETDASAQSSARKPFISQIPLLRVSKEHQNNIYYSSPKKMLTRKAPPGLLSIVDWKSSGSQTQPPQPPESVKLPLLSIHSTGKASADIKASPTDEYRLAEIRENDVRWNHPIPLLNAPPTSHYAQQKETLPTTAQPQHPVKPCRSTAIAHGPALLQQYDESNRQKEELLTRMIRAMRAKARPVEEEGRPSHPKYQLLKLSNIEPPVPGPVRPQAARATSATKKAQKHQRSQKTRRRQKVTQDTKTSANLPDLATVSEKTEETVKTVDVGTDSTEPVETVEKAVQHSIAHTDSQFTDYSYLFSLATSKDVVEERDQELDAAANDNNFAAVQYKAVKLQQELDTRPQMVDASVMAVEPAAKTVVVQSIEDTTAPVIAPNLMHEMQFRTVQSTSSLANKENIPEARREYLGVVDVTPEEPPMISTEPAALPPAKPRSQQILLEIESNRLPDSTETSQKPSSPVKPPIVPYYESAELPEPRIITPRAKFISADSRDDGKLTIARNLSNMADRLEYIEELRDDMMKQINDTEMVLPRFHPSYQQRQTQTRLSIGVGDEFATILEPPSKRPAPQSKATPRKDSARQPKLYRQQSDLVQDTAEEGLSVPNTPSARAPSSRYASTGRPPSTFGDESKPSDDLLPTKYTRTVKSPVSARSAKRWRSALSARSPTSARSVTSDGELSILEDGSEILRLAEQIVGDDESLTGDVNSTLLADLLMSDVSHLTPRLGDSPAKHQRTSRGKEEMKRWRKEHQAKVREKYNQEVETKRQAEARPFQSQKQVTGKQIQRVKEEQQAKREKMIANNQSKRLENAENLLEDILGDGAELLAMERMMDLTTPIATRKSTKSVRRPSQKKAPTALQRGKSIIRAPPGEHTGYTPSGFHTVAQPSQHTLMDDNSYDVDDLPLYDESQLLVPKFVGVDERERLHQLLHPDTPLSQFGSEISLSNISEFAPRSEMSGESYLDWDVVDEMVAMLSNRESSAPSTPAGLA